MGSERSRKKDFENLISQFQSASETNLFLLKENFVEVTKIINLISKERVLSKSSKRYVLKVIFKRSKFVFSKSRKLLSLLFKLDSFLFSELELSASQTIFKSKLRTNLHDSSKQLLINFKKHFIFEKRFFVSSKKNAIHLLLNSDYVSSLDDFVSDLNPLLKTLELLINDLNAFVTFYSSFDSWFPQKNAGLVFKLNFPKTSNVYILDNNFVSKLFQSFSVGNFSSFSKLTGKTLLIDQVKSEMDRHLQILSSDEKLKYSRFLKLFYAAFNVKELSVEISDVDWFVDLWKRYSRKAVKAKCQGSLDSAMSDFKRTDIYLLFLLKKCSNSIFLGEDADIVDVVSGAKDSSGKNIFNNKVINVLVFNRSFQLLN